MSAFSQRDPDVLAANSQVVIAWTDASSTARGTDVKARLYSAATLAPLGGELELGATLDDEADVALAAFGTGWAAAWRAGAPGGASETVVAKVDGKTFYAGPQATTRRSTSPFVIARAWAELGGHEARWPQFLQRSRRATR